MMMCVRAQTCARGGQSVCSGAYSEEAVEVGEVEGMCDLRQDVQRQLPLIGRLAALVRRAAQSRDMAGVQGLDQELQERERAQERQSERH